jgi:hypothetical protein
MEVRVSPSFTVLFQNKFPRSSISEVTIACIDPKGGSVNPANTYTVNNIRFTGPDDKLSALLDAAETVDDFLNAVGVA